MNSMNSEPALTKPATTNLQGALTQYNVLNADFDDALNILNEVLNPVLTQESTKDSNGGPFPEIQDPGASAYTNMVLNSNDLYQVRLNRLRDLIRRVNL